MAICYQIPYTDCFGAHISVKWGGTPQEAASFLRAHLTGTPEIGTPEALDPQPFTDEYRAKRVREKAAQAHAGAPAPVASTPPPVTAALAPVIPFARPDKAA